MKKTGGRNVGTGEQQKRVGGSTKRVTADNPFETRKNKTRFEVMGRKVKGTVVKSNKALQDGHKKRQETIGVEFELRGKTGEFVDRRFGERDEVMDEGEKMGVRFQQERLRQSRNMFSLTGEEDLTHLGMSLGKASSSQGGGGPNTLEDDLFFQVHDDDAAFGGERGLMDEEVVKNLHFGGGDAASNVASSSTAPRKKTKREVMDEIVAKSKQYRAQRKQENQEHFELVQQLDSQLKDITPFLSILPSKSSKAARAKDEAEPKLAKLNKDDPDEKIVRAHEPDYVADEYDVLVRELRTQTREAHAVDRLRSQAEEAEARMARLRTLELMRERRMGGEEGQVGLEEGAEDGGLTLAAIIAGALPKKRSQAGDQESGDSDEKDDDDGEEADAASSHRPRHRHRKRAKDAVAARGDWVLQRRWARDMLDEEVALQDGDLMSVVHDKRTGEELPFVLAMPNSAEELWSLLGSNELHVCNVALQRILGNTDPHLDPNNALKLHRLLCWLLVASVRGPTDESSVRECIAWSDMIFNAIRRLLLMLPSADGHGFHSEASPYFPFRVLLNVMGHVEPCVPSGCTVPDVEYLQPAKSEGRRSKRKQQDRVTYFDETQYPTTSLACSLLQMLRVFSSSDKFHPICSPVLVYLMGILSTAPHLTSHHYAISLLIADALFKPMHEAKRFAPEPLSFYVNVLEAQLQRGGDSAAPPHWASVELDDRQRQHCGQGIAGYIKSWVQNGLASHARPLVLKALETMRLFGDELQPFVESCAGLLDASVAPLQRLQLRPHKVVPVPDLKPLLFLTDAGGFSVSRDHDPDADRRRDRALKKQVKQERRGAMKELKRDRAFLNALKAQELVSETAERQTSLKKIMNFLQDQQAEAKVEAKVKTQALKL